MRVLGFGTVLSIVWCHLVLSDEATAYSSSLSNGYGLSGNGKRYGSSGNSGRGGSSSWSPLPVYPRNARPAYPPPPAFYAAPADPYAQEYTETIDPQLERYYYPIDPFEKYRFYQVPYYYPEPNPYASYFGGMEEAGLTDAGSAEEDEEQDRDGAEMSSSSSAGLFPYETSWYGSSSGGRKDANAEANAVFLRNLILAQMYKDTIKSLRPYRPSTSATYYLPYGWGGFGSRNAGDMFDYDDGTSYVYGEPVADPTSVVAVSSSSSAGRSPSPSSSQYMMGGGFPEDEEVRELKSLAPPPEPSRAEVENIFAEQKAARRRSSMSERWPSKRATTESAATPAPSQPQRAREKGQEEVVLPRPASPPRQPTSNLHSTRAREPSVYDSIKKLLHMQDQMEQHGESTGSRPQKRSYIPSEESLVEQLGNLKKSA